MNNKIKIIREKLNTYWKIFIDKDLLQKILNKFAPNYTINDLSFMWLIIPIKRGKSYINTFSKEVQDHFKVGDTYFEWWQYMFWWLGIYNQYWFSTQVVEWHTIYNTKVSWKRIIWNNKFILKKQIDSFFYWSKTIKEWNSTYKIMSPERAFIQMIKEWADVFEVPKSIDKKKLIKMSSKYTSKRINNIIKKICL